MAVIQGVIANYQTATHVSGTSGGEVGGVVSSSHIASFQINGQIAQLRSGAPAGLVNGDTVRVTGALDSSGIFQVRYYFNSTRKCHSPPPEFGFFQFIARLFLAIGTLIFLLCLAFDWIELTETKGADFVSLVVGNIAIGLLGLFFWGFGQRWNNGIKSIERKYREFMRAAYAENVI